MDNVILEIRNRIERAGKFLHEVVLDGESEEFAVVDGAWMTVKDEPCRISVLQAILLGVPSQGNKERQAMIQEAAADLHCSSEWLSGFLDGMKFKLI